MEINSGGGETYAVMRVGRKVARTIYLQAGPAPSDADRLIGLMDSPVLAGAVVGAVNAAWQITQAFEHDLAIDPGDEVAARWLELLRPIWAAGWVPGGAPPGA